MVSFEELTKGLLDGVVRLITKLNELVFTNIPVTGIYAYLLLAAIASFFAWMIKERSNLSKFTWLAITVAFYSAFRFWNLIIPMSLNNNDALIIMLLTGFTILWSLSDK